MHQEDLSSLPMQKEHFRENTWARGDQRGSPFLSCLTETSQHFQELLYRLCLTLFSLFPQTTKLKQILS